MSYKLLGGGSDLNTVISDVNQNILELKNREVTEIFKDSTGQRRVLMGQGANGFYGMKVSKPGFDVYSAPDDQLIFNSGQNVFKVVQTGTFTTTQTYTLGSPGAGNFSTTEFTLATIPHGLGYTPATLGYATSGSEYFPLPAADAFGAGTTAHWDLFYISADNTNIYIKLDLTVYGGGVTYGAGFGFKYYLLQETASKS